MFVTCFSIFYCEMMWYYSEVSNSFSCTPGSYGTISSRLFFPKIIYFLYYKCVNLNSQSLDCEGKKKKMEGEGCGRREKATSSSLQSPNTQFHVFNLRTACSVIFASTLTTHQSDSKWCWHKITRHGTKHLANKEIPRKNAITKMAYHLNSETLELFVDGSLSFQPSHSDFPTSLSFLSLWSLSHTLNKMHCILKGSVSSWICHKL